jgi:HPt (histidine-containing phosphotransfer) domain-containing protein
MLRRMMGDLDLASAVVEGFLDDIPRQIQALKGFLESGDALAAQRQAHSIKGASANVGGERLRETALRVETAARSGDLAYAGLLMAELGTRFDQLKKAMEHKDKG